MERLIFHIDVNSAFLSWTALDQLHKGNPLDLRTVPAIIGGDISKRHGVVLAKSIPAKKYGIITGEPVTDAVKKCPEVLVAKPDHHLYREMSHKFIDLVRSYCPVIEQVSVDECYMDYLPIRAQYPDPVACAIRIKDDVYQRFGFTVNVGISDRKVLAKMASDFRKPNLVHTLYHDEIRQKMWQLPVSDLYMCGKSSVEVLHNLGITTIGELAQTDREILSSHLKKHGLLLWRFANGIDDSEVETEREEVKGVGNSTTLPQDARTNEEVQAVLHDLCRSVAGRLQKKGLLAGNLSVELKFHDFTTNSHQMMLSKHSNREQDLYEAAWKLTKELWDGTPIRLIGVRTTKLQDHQEVTQLSIFELPSPKQQKLDRALQGLQEKYGDAVVHKGMQ